MTDHGLVAFAQVCFRSRAASTSVGAGGKQVEVLGRGDVWRLLHAGASDVMEWSEDAIAHQIFAKVERHHLLERATAEALANEPIVRS